MAEQLSLSQAWIQAVQLSNERALAKAFHHTKEVARLDKQIKSKLGVVIDKGMAKNSTRVKEVR